MLIVKSQTLVLLSVGIITVPAHAEPASATAGYKVVAPSWGIELFPGKPLVELKGTIQEVYEQAIALNPTWKPIPVNVTAVTPGSAAPKIRGRSPESQPDGHGLAKRDFSICGPGQAGYWGSTPTTYIQDGINYLRGVPGQPRLSAGFGTCARVSCSYQSAILWCNDNPYDVEIWGFGRIADGAQVIVNECQTWENIGNGFYRWYVSGQRFDSDNVNFIVTRDNC